MNYHQINPIIIGFTGYKQAGKNIAASQIGLALLRFIPNQKFEAFASGVKQEVADAFGITLQQLEEIKNNPIVRHCLQWHGTENSRQQKGVGVWIRALESRLPEPVTRSLLLITDVRFRNEADWIRDRGGSIIYVERKGLVNTDTHASEVEIDKLSPDYRLYNDGERLESVTREARFISGYIKEKYGF